MSTRPVIDRDGGRKADLAAIHVGKKALGWTDEEYRDILWITCTVRSSAELDIAGRKRFLAHMRACGFTQAGREPAKRSSKPLTPRQAKAWSLWQQLADAQAVKDRTRPAFESYIKRQTGVDKLAWLNGAQEDLVIESLKAWLKRAEDDKHAA